LGPIPSSRPMRPARSRPAYTHPYTSPAATIVNITAFGTVLCVGTTKVASVQPTRPEANAIVIDSTPVSRSELCATAGRYSQNRIAGPANGPSVRKLLHANATAPYRQRSDARVRVWLNAI